VTDLRSPDDLVLAYVDGSLDARERSEFEARLAGDPALRADVEGLRAVHEVLGRDRAFGEASGTDVPPPHLLDAILRAEVVARPAEIREAMGLLRDPPQAKPWWARLQSFWMGGGVVVGAAAAVLFVVTRTDQLDRAPTAPSVEATSTSTSTNTAEDAKAKKAEADPPKSAPPAKEGNAPAAEPPPPPPSSELQTGAPLDDETAGAPQKPRDAKPKPAQAQLADATPQAEKDALAFDGDSGLDLGNAGLGAGRGAGPVPAAMPAAPSTPPSTTAPAPTPVGGGFVPAKENARRITEVLKAKKQAKIEAERMAEQKKAPSTKSAPKADAANDHYLTPTEAREEIARKKRIDDASLMLTTAERELASGNAKNALELAQSAESQAGATLGLYPAALQARAFVVIDRPSDAARVGSRLLSADPADPLLVDGILAAAQGALAVGDHRLAERLLQRALLPANKDTARRAKAQAQLNTLQGAIRNRAAAPAALEAPSTSTER
jgi:hypothetical protein